MPSSRFAVASSLVRSQRAMLPAPTSVTDAGGGVIVTVVVADPAAPSLSATLTRTTAVPAASLPAPRRRPPPGPAAPYVCVAVTGAAWLAVLPVVCKPPSPQSIAYDQGASLLPGSANVALRGSGAPAVTVWLGPAFTAGATSAMVAVVVTGALAAPCASVTVSVTT